MFKIGLGPLGPPKGFFGMGHLLALLQTSTAQYCVAMGPFCVYVWDLPSFFGGGCVCFRVFSSGERVAKWSKKGEFVGR